MNTIKKIAVSMLVLLSCIGLSACGSSTGESVVSQVDTVQSEAAKTQDTANDELTESETTEITSETEPNEDVQSLNEKPLSSDDIQSSDEKLPSSDDIQSSNEILPSSDPEVIVVVFSATGTTKGVAEKIAVIENADFYEIIPSEPYSDADLNWNDPDSRTTKEQNDSSVRPEIAGELIELDNYTRIYIGYPIWWGEEPRIMDTFVESYDFGNAEVIPFCTSGGSGIGRSGSNLASLAGSGNWLDGDRLDAGISEEELQTWINGLN